MTWCDLPRPVAVACAVVLLSGCGAAADAGVRNPAPPSPGSGTGSSPPAALLDELLAARTANDPQRFAALVSRAAATCDDPAATRQLGQLSAVADRWADSIAFARPKAQARTEAQLSEVDWRALLTSCGRA